MASLYSPYKAIGYVCDSNPFVINRLGEEIFLTMSIGQCFQVFRFNKLVSCIVSKPASGIITCMQVLGQETFVAVDNTIIVYNRANIVRTYKVHRNQILGLICIGYNLVSYDSSNQIKIIDIKARELATEMTVLQPSRISTMIHPATYVNKVLIAYVNGEMELWNVNKKVLIYTFLSHKSHFANRQSRGTIDGDDSADDPQPGDSMPSISCIEQSPACDVVAVGFCSGDILLVNLKLDQVLFAFRQEGGAVTALSFRTDAQADRCPYMVSSTSDGRLHVWNLGSGENGEGGSQRRLQCSLDEAHVGPVSRVAFLHGEPIMVSTGASDNSVKVWIFDSPDGTARLLRSREGHSGGPTRIRYYGGTTNVSMRDNADGMSCELISAGSDGTLRLFNTAIESQNRELSQKPMLKALGLQRRNERLPECVAFDFSETRQRDWGNMATAHRNHCDVYVWKFRHRVITNMVLRQPSWVANERKAAVDRRNHATSVAISPCGNFCLVGYKGGAVYKYNIQSGKSRGTYPRSGRPDMKKGQIQQRARVPGNVLYEERRMAEDAMLSTPGLAAVGTAAALGPSDAAASGAHDQEVTGLFVDMTNATLVSCALDGKVSFWDLSSHALLHQVALETPQLLMQGFRDGNFVAVAGQDRTVRVYDMHTFKLSRRFSGHSQEITDLAFTPDGRRLLSSSGDSTVRVWDIPTGRCLSWLRFSSPVLSMAVSLSGEYLCVAQADKEGVFMYVDRSLYETVHFWKEPTCATPVADAVVSIEEDTFEETKGANFFEGVVVEKLHIDPATEEMGSVIPSQAQVVSEAQTETAHQRGEGAITLSAVPRAYWTSLFHLETIKKRNKPKAPPAPAPLAPFFLPTIVRGGATPSFPTPAEYAALTKDLASTATPVVPVKRAVGEESDGAPATKKVRGGGNDPVDAIRAVGGAVDETEVMAELAQMGSAWEDDDADTASWVLDRTAGDAAEDSTSVATDVDVVAPVSAVTSGQTKNNSRSQSRLISKKTVLPRCKLVAYLLQDASTHGDFVDAAAGTYSALLEYLKQLPPPAVDLEIRALCSHEGDEEGVALLRYWLGWLRERIDVGDHFEILQAYLHRTLTIYAELAMKVPQLAADLRTLSIACMASGDRFRAIVQKNLCLMKMMASIPIA